MALTRLSEIDPFEQLQQPILRPRVPVLLQLGELNESLSDPILRQEPLFQTTAQQVLKTKTKLIAEYDDNGLICWVGLPKPQKHVPRSSVTEEK